MSNLKRFLPAGLLMAAIYIASSTPSDDLPDYGWLDMLVKKGGHAVGYGLLASAYWYAMRHAPGRGRLAWLLALLYAASDELHQLFTPGRHPSIIDLLVFDGGGAALGTWLTSLWLKRRRG